MTSRVIHCTLQKTAINEKKRYRAIVIREVFVDFISSNWINRIHTEFFAVETLRTTIGSLQSVEQFILCLVPILV